MFAYFRSNLHKYLDPEKSSSILYMYKAQYGYATCSVCPSRNMTKWKKKEEIYTYVNLMLHILIPNVYAYARIIR